MRRFLIFLLICLAPLWAHAAPDTPYDASTVPRYALLTAEQQSLLDTLYAAARAGDTRVNLPAGTRYDDAAAAMDLLILDYPELAGLDKQYAIGYWQHDPDRATYVELRYTVTGGERSKRRAALLREANALVSEAAGTAFDRELYLHDALCNRVSYDLSAEHAHDAYGALVEGRAACEGYAQAMTLLCRMAGIPCGMVSGLAWDGAYMSAHAWNFLCIGGVWCYTDATWDDQQTTTHWYFNLTEAQMAADHQPEEVPSLPAGEGAEYHRAMGLEADSLQAAEDILLQALPSGFVSIRFVSEADYAAFTEDLSAALERYNTRAEAPFYGSYRVMTSPHQRCVILILS